MGYQPVPVHGVPGEPSSEVVVDAPFGHMLQGDGDGLSGTVRPRLVVYAEKKLQHRLLGELGGLSEPAEPAVVGGEDLTAGHLKAVGGGNKTARYPPGYRLHQVRRLGIHPVALVPPNLGDGLDDLEERRHTVAGLFGEIGAGEEGTSLMVKPDGHRPSPMAGHGLDGLHVDRVDVGSLLPVHLHVDEETIHHRRGVGVFEGLVGHHMTPMAGGISDAQQDGDVTAASFSEGLLTPLVPVHGVVLVLEKVRGGSLGETIRHIRGRYSYRPAYRSGPRGRLSTKSDWPSVSR